MRHSLLLKSVISAATLCSFQAQAAVIFNYTNFSSTAGLTLAGNAATTTTSDGTVLRVTPSAGTQAGAVYSTTPVTLGSNATFSTSFQFRFTSPAGIDPADGITFVLSASPSGLGSTGIGMGYSGVPNSVAIEFDTFNNYGSLAGEPNSSNHIAVDTNGSLQNLAASSVYGNPSCGFTNGSPAQNTYTAAGCMSNGNLWTATITYNGSLLNVSVLDPAKGTTFSAISNYSISIASLLGTTNAYAGFTASTGSGQENHDIVKWQLDNTATLTSIPEPTSLIMAGAGLFAVALFAKRRG